MYGWRGLFGYIAPAAVGQPAKDMFDMLPEGVGVLLATLLIESHDDAEIRREQQGQIRAALGLAKSGAQFIVAGGGPVVVAGGPGRDTQIIDAIREATGLGATTNLTAAIDALRSLGARRIAIASPFKAEIDQRYREFMAASGFEVTAIAGPHCPGNKEIGELDEYASYRAGREAVAASDGPADALYITCGRWPAVDMIEPLETDLGIPVVASNQACVWAALHAFGVNEPIYGFGRLMGGS